MEFKEDVRNHVKDYLTELLPKDSASRVIAANDIDELLFNNDISKPLTDFEKKNPDENSIKDFISAMKFGLNLGVRYGVLTFIDQVTTLNTENTEDTN